MSGFRPRSIPYPILLCFVLPISLPLLGQTDETIFRAFQFDFSTPGARANGMGRAFVGLADEATAGYSNPAGLSVLDTPEFYLEWRTNHTDFQAITESDEFYLDPTIPPTDTSFDLNRIGFSSLSFSWGNYNFSVFFVNNLDYRRDPIEEVFLAENIENGYQVFLNNENHVGHIRLDTLGLSISRSFGNLDVGISVGSSTLDLDFSYFTSLASVEIDELNDLVRSNARGSSIKASYVLGLLYRLRPGMHLGFSAKLHPRFVYTEMIENNTYPVSTGVPITFKVPDSYQLGFGWQPNDRWTILADVDWIRYGQLLDHMTILSKLPIKREDFDIGESPDLRFGAEYLIPAGKVNWALRGGFFRDPDHKTRFVAAEQEDMLLRDVHDTQRFLYNTDDKEDNRGYTLGLGMVLNDKIQLDAAYVDSNRFRRFVASLLYRF
ncbi:MAG: hypothetical protein QNK37_26390 [Acidobacteriota bacterium]|nr:hypothetical protein [Acidobacteriota bacterium]